MSQCQALTKGGKGPQCSRKVSSGQYCFQHPCKESDDSTVSKSISPITVDEDHNKRVLDKDEVATRMGGLPLDIRNEVEFYRRGQELKDIVKDLNDKEVGFRYNESTRRFDLYLGNNKDKIKINTEGLVNYLYARRELDRDLMMKKYGHKLTDEQRNFDWEESYDDLWDLKFEPSKYQDDEYFFKKEYLNDLDENLSIHQILDKYDTVQESDPNLPKLTDFHLFSGLGNVVSLIVQNYRGIRGINQDLRGVDPLDFALYYWPFYKIYNKKGVTIEDLLTSLYKVRSHKFENNYELFTGIKRIVVKELDDGIELFISVDFDHGS